MKPNLNKLHAEFYRANREQALNILDNPEKFPPGSGLAQWAQLVVDNLMKEISRNGEDYIRTEKAISIFEMPIF